MLSPEIVPVTPFKEMTPLLVTVMLFVEEERIMPEPWRRPIVPFMPLRVVVVL